MDSAEAILKPDTAFSYGCRRCGQCCHDKRIQINPYETARLQRRLGETTAEFRSRHTLDGVGMVLAQQAGGACVFFREDGCSVHPDRPLVCRLFPLGRQVAASGEARILKSEFDPPPAGDFGRNGTVAAYFDAQGAGPFIAAADAYFAWYVRAVDNDGHDNADGDAAAYGDLTDMDSVLAAHARKTGTAEPGDIESRTTLHLSLLNSLI